MIKRCILIVLLSIQWLLCQQPDSAAQSVTAYFQNFQYKKVVQAADSLIRHSELSDTTSRLELLRMKAIALYSLNKPEEAQYTFLDILELKPDYAMDPYDTPPKIVDLFNVIKTSYNSRRPKPSEIRSPSTQNKTTSLNTGAAVIRSVLVPGWGHLSIDRNLKGKWLLFGTALTLAPAAYYGWDAYQKEQKYLNETNRDQIEKRYKSYNSSYKTRNIFLFVYTGIWIYSQLDLLQPGEKQTSPVTLAVTSSAAHNDIFFLQFCLRF